MPVAIEIRVADRISRVGQFDLGSRPETTPTRAEQDGQVFRRPIAHHQIEVPIGVPVPDREGRRAEPDGDGVRTREEEQS